jgi:hypothetical protein
MLRVVACATTNSSSTACRRLLHVTGSQRRIPHEPAVFHRVARYVSASPEVRTDRSHVLQQAHRCHVMHHISHWGGEKKSLKHQLAALLLSHLSTWHCEGHSHMLKLKCYTFFGSSLCDTKLLATPDDAITKGVLHIAQVLQNPRPNTSNIFACGRV